MTPFRQQYPHANGECQIPNARLTLDYALSVEIYILALLTTSPRVVRKYIIIGVKNIFLKPTLMDIDTQV